MHNYRGSRVVIIGLGITGLSCVNFFLDRGVIPKVIDTRIYPPGIKKLPHVVQCCLGVFNDIWLLSATLIVVSPGVRLDHPILIEALKLGIEIIGDIELFAREATAPIIAITGSNGKSTVTQLVSRVARGFGWRVGVAGNIGVPALSLLNKSYQLYILEISSFQLDTTHSLRAIAAVILNVSEDHMDHYSGGLKQYWFSKQRIYKNAKICVMNASDTLTTPIYNDYDHCISFGENEYSADYYLKYYKGHTWIVAYNEYVLNCSKMRINNRINYINALSALALSDIVKIPRSVSLKVLCQFSGLTHRCQLIYKNHGVSWINDSKATNVNATKEAINNLTLSGTLHLILGGDGKLADFSSLKHLIKQHEIHLYCFGKDGLLLTTLGFSDVIFTNTMIQAMRIINRRIKSKDIVLLSPACSSLDQFKSFEMRGLVFTSFAREFG
ncbi:UDP-N-acetylmuramoyl-L-alanine--D-glutamate ligase [Blochmannia endosymbiont of Camponotus sp.]|uniref:UDP-N-acetylmuramoyl-L-alanine--D-glutamate ligase n=1 Tax=Blochmannia endosymbiont of Camponotus sp. TaxID=700220 RepID=UPI002025AC8C|nr:UDP-N-acetylmuramoyl-L-alanine--D-glutamate ligase [Blochmannia endosymbiont of Camponotus sp.]URJ24061.1 UDP-N-acetylmuramoyl-L-alanine--D-glutamate ligase [Blochmannia endosymbiont of Camponotus sp.]